MPTATRPPSPAQIRFVAALASERQHLAASQTPHGAIVRRALALVDDPAYFESREVSTLITELLAIRVGRSAPADAAPQANAHGAADMPAPTLDIRAGRMLAAGSIEATVTLLDGRHVTVTIRTRTRSGRGWTNADLGADGSRTTIGILGSKVGWINRHGDQYRLTLRTRRPEYVAAVNALLAYCAGVTLLDGVLRVQEASRCGRCFRTLTDPVSIDRGVGPECFGRSTGSEHVSTMRGLETVADALTTPLDPGYEATLASTTPEIARRVERERVAQPSLTSLAAVAASPVLSRDAERARDLISEALDAYCSAADRDFAMRVFDDLAAA